MQFLAPLHESQSSVLEQRWKHPPLMQLCPAEQHWVPQAVGHGVVVDVVAAAVVDVVVDGVVVVVVVVAGPAVVVVAGETSQPGPQVPGGRQRELPLP